MNVIDPGPDQAANDRPGAVENLVVGGENEGWTLQWPDRFGQASLANTGHNTRTGEDQRRESWWTEVITRSL